MPASPSVTSKRACAPTNTKLPKMAASALPGITMAFSRFPSLLLACGMALALSACVVPPAGPGTQPLASGAALVGTDWVAVQIAGVAKVLEPAPRLRWTAADCFDAHRIAGLEPNPLYTQGMSRVGCMPCINANKPELQQIGRRFPDHIARIVTESYVARHCCLFLCKGL